MPEQAAAQALKALDRDADYLPALLLLAELHLDRGDATDAEERARRIIELTPSTPERAQHLLADALAMQGRFGEAYELLAAEPDPVASEPALHIRWLISRGMVLMEQHRWEEADADFAMCVERAPDTAEAWYRRAELARRRGRAEETKEYARRALAVDRDHIPARAALGASYMIRGELQKAITVHDEALERDPEYRFGLLLRAQAAAATADAEGARRILGRALALDPDNRDFQREKGWIELSIGELDRAVEIFDGLSADEPDADALAGRAEVRRLSGRTVEAISLAEQALRLRPDDLQTMRTLGFALLETGQPARALEIFGRACRILPDDVRVQVDLGAAYAALEETGRALELFDATCAQSPNDTCALGRFADLLIEVGHYEAALFFYERLQSVNPADMTGWAGSGWAMRFAEPPDPAAAEGAFRTAVGLDEGNLWLQKDVAGALHQIGDQDEAAVLYRLVRASAEAAQDDRPDLLELSAWCAFRLKEYDQASRAYQQLVTTRERTTSLHFDLAMVLFCSGRVRRAVRMYDELVGLEDRHELLRRGLLVVARSDFRQALVDTPALASTKEASRISEVLDSAIRELPPLPELRSEWTPRPL